MGAPEIQALRNRMEAIEQQLGELSRDVRLALGYLDHDPESAVTKAGRAVEGMLALLHRRRLGEPPRRATLDVLKEALRPTLPPTLIHHIEYVQRLRNHAAHPHPEPLTSAEVVAVLNASLCIAEWFVNEVGEGDLARPPPRRSGLRLGSLGLGAIVALLVGGAAFWFLRAPAPPAIPATLTADPLDGLRRRLAAPATAWESPLTGAELDALLADPRALGSFDLELRRDAQPAPTPSPTRLAKETRPVLLRPDRLADARAFLRAHAAELEAARARGVAPEDVVAILLWQSNLGRATDGARHRLVAALLAQLSGLEAEFAEVRRSGAVREDELDRHARRIGRKLDRAEIYLASLLRWAKASGHDPLELRGWWNGELGAPQFVATSLRWAEDGNGDGRIDLYEPADAIASVAGYLAAHGYGRDRRAALRAFNPVTAWVDGVIETADALR